MKSYSSLQTTPPSVTFLGAARSVTGSMHLIESGPHRLLLDCGMTRGTPEEQRRNREFPFDPATIDAVILSHAHVDHCGNLPNLVRQGFTGPIYCTPPTRELLAVMLADSARIHEAESRVASVVGHSAARREPRESKPFGRRDVNAVVEQVIAAEYGTPFAVNADVQATFLDAGHILGSAIVAMKLLHGGREHTITFTGDLGRRGLPFLHQPSAVPPADLIISESTYGGKTHDSAEGMADKMAAVVARTVQRGGKVLIPAFSLGRTQVVAHYVRRWMASGVLPRLPVYVDSPLAADVSVIHDEFPDHLHEQAEERVPIEYLLDADDARLLTTEDGPAVIIASGGMCEGGRILSHLKFHVDDPRSSVVLVSYQAPASVGAKLLEKRPTVRFHGRNWNKWVEVSQINGFSGHADQIDFEALFGSAVGKTGKIRLVHGEVEQAKALEARLTRMGFADVDVPMRKEEVAVSTKY